MSRVFFVLKWCRTHFPPSDRIRLLIHGIELPKTTPLLQIWLKLSHADFFLYIVVVEALTE